MAADMQQHQQHTLQQYQKGNIGSSICKMKLKLTVATDVTILCHQGDTMSVHDATRSFSKLLVQHSLHRSSIILDMAVEVVLGCVTTDCTGICVNSQLVCTGLPG